MTKETTTIQIDSETKLWCDKLKIKYGPTCNKFLRNLVEQYLSDQDGKDLYAIEGRLEELQDKMQELSIERTKLMEEKEAILEAQRQKRKKANKETLNMVQGIKNSGIIGELG